MTHGTCGLHFHINKEYFGNTTEEIENNIDKLIVFTEYYKDNLIKFSRRNCFDYCHFLGDKRGLTNEQRLNILRVKKEKFNVDRYMVVNTENSKTVEFRLIRGTLNFNTFMASVEFIFSLARIIKNKKITEISWDDVICYEGNEFVSQYCNERHIEPNSKKMKDYSIDYLKKQNKIKSDIAKNKREVLVKVYEMLVKITKKIPDEYSALSDNIPEKYSAKIKPELLIKKYKNKNTLVLANQYLIDIISSYEEYKDNRHFLNNINYCVSGIERNTQMKRKINSIDNSFLKFLERKFDLIVDLNNKVDESDYTSLLF